MWERTTARRQTTTQNRLDRSLFKFIHGAKYWAERGAGRVATKDEVSPVTSTGVRESAYAASGTCIPEIKATAPLPRAIQEVTSREEDAFTFERRSLWYNHRLARKLRLRDAPRYEYVSAACVPPESEPPDRIVTHPHNIQYHPLVKVPIGNAATRYHPPLWCISGLISIFEEDLQKVFSLVRRPKFHIV